MPRKKSGSILTTLPPVAPADDMIFALAEDAPAPSGRLLLATISPEDRAALASGDAFCAAMDAASQAEYVAFNKSGGLARLIETVPVQDIIEAVRPGRLWNEAAADQRHAMAQASRAGR